MTYGLADVVQQRRLIEMSEADDAYKRLSTAKLDAMLGLAEAADCRRVRLLAYFGEESTPCGNCDNCLAPPQVRDASEDAKKLLSCIYRCQQASGFGFAATHIIDVLRGKLTDKVQKFGHGKLSTFGVGADVGEAEWRLLLRQLVAQHLVEVDYERFNVLRLTEASRAVLRGERRIELRRQLATARGKARKAKAAAAGTMDAAAAALYERLRAWRADDAVAHLYDPLHPAVLSLIAAVIRTATQHQKPVAVCGEMAGDVSLTRLLLGMGLRTFSMHPASVLAVKQRVLTTSLPDIAPMVARVMKLDDPEKLVALVEKLNA